MRDRHVGYQRTAVLLTLALALMSGSGSVAAEKKTTEKKSTSPAPFAKNEDSALVVRQAFGLRDEAGIEAIKRYNQETSKNPLPIWKGLYDFNAPEKKGDLLEPWLTPSKTKDGKGFSELDITNKEQALIFAKIMQQYVYEGWFNKENALTPDHQFRENEYRTWCSTPWLVDGPKGREAVHGLTKEFPMHPNPIYAAETSKKNSKGEPLFDEKTKPMSWGVAYFNRPVCEAYEQIFGTPEKPRLPLNPDVANPDGFVSFKLLFNTLQGWEGYPAWKGAYSWMAHVGDHMFRSSRTLQRIPHVQMDISFKDSRLRGTNKDVDHWVMLTYVFDASYFDGDLDVAHLPEALRKMRPVGVQYGLERGQSIIFDGAKTNFQVADEWIVSGPETMLNGPADNPKSSCLGCHAAAGFDEVTTEFFGASALSLFPNTEDSWKFTLYKNEHYQHLKNRYGQGFDFNRQTEIAYKRYILWLEGK